MKKPIEVFVSGVKLGWKRWQVIQRPCTALDETIEYDSNDEVTRVRSGFVFSCPNGVVGESDFGLLPPNVTVNRIFRVFGVPDHHVWAKPHIANEDADHGTILYADLNLRIDYVFFPDSKPVDQGERRIYCFFEQPLSLPNAEYGEDLRYLGE